MPDEPVFEEPDKKKNLFLMPVEESSNLLKLVVLSYSKRGRDVSVMSLQRVLS